MSRLFAWAKNPMIKRIHQLSHSIPMTVIYGKNSWMKHITLNEFIEARGTEQNTKVEVSVISGNFERKTVIDIIFFGFSLYSYLIIMNFDI